MVPMRSTDLVIQICACAPALKTILANPIATATSRVSSRISSLLSPKGSIKGTKSSKSSPTASKASWFDPLRSLPWFQLPTWGFEDIHKRSQARSHIDLEDNFVVQELKPLSDPELHDADDFTSRDTAIADIAPDEGSVGPATPSLRMSRPDGGDLISWYPTQVVSPPPHASKPVLPEGLCEDTESWGSMSSR